MYTIQLRKKDVLAFARVRVSSQYFTVLDCVSYSCAREKEIMALVMVRVSRQYFPVFGLYIVQYARRTSWLSLGLGLTFSILSLGLNKIQLRKKDVLTLARIRVSSQYFPVLDCVSYSCARKRS